MSSSSEGSRDHGTIPYQRKKRKTTTETCFRPLPRSQEPASLNDLLRQTTREPLFVRPENWSPRYLELLRCQFDPEIPVPADGGPQSTDYANRASSSSSRLEFVFAKRHSFHFAVGSPLGLRPPQMPTELYHSDGSAPPVFCQIDTCRIQQQRYFATKTRFGAWSEESMRSREMLANRATPPDPFTDPYIAACMIALAQSQAELRLKDRGQTELQRSDKFPAHLLLCSPADKTTIRLYSAKISAPFLEMLDDPSRPFADPLHIGCRVIPYRPYATFHLRLWDEIQPLPPAESADRERAVRALAEERRREDDKVCRKVDEMNAREREELERAEEEFKLAEEEWNLVKEAWEPAEEKRKRATEARKRVENLRRLVASR